MSPVPGNWARTTLGEVGRLITGGTPPTSEPEMYGGELPFVKPPHLQDRPLERTEQTISEAGRSFTKTAPPGATLIACIGNLGKTGIARQEVAFNQQLNAVVFGEAVDPRFGFYQAQTLRPYLESVASATTISIVNKSKLSKAPFLLPPIGEQQRIVLKIEELFSDLDAGVASLQRAKLGLQRYRASLLKAAVEGKLTEKWRKENADVEPGSDLLKRILEERRRRWQAEQLTKYARKGKRPPGGWQKGYQEPEPPELDRHMPSIPETWTWTTLEALSDDTRGITYGVIKLGEPVEGGVPTLRSSNVRSLRLDLDYVKPIAEELSRKYSRTILSGGEVLVTVRGTLGGVAVVPAGCAGFNVSREVAVAPLLEPCVGAGVASFVASEPLQNWINRNTKGIAYVGINLETLRRLPVPLAPASEMTAISEAVGEALDATRTTLAMTREIAARSTVLRQAVLHRAFEGRLVPQDPSDEPASILLERIKAERGQSVTKKPPRGRRKKREDEKQYKLIPTTLDQE